MNNVKDSALTEQERLERVFVSRSLIMAEQYLRPMKISLMPDDKMRVIRNVIMPKKCFNNSALAASYLRFGGVVLGAAIINYSGISWPVEHAWVWDGDETYYDPTYQVLDEDIPKGAMSVIYYGLLQLSLDECRELSLDVHGDSDVNSVIDFMTLRRNPRLSYLFNSRRD